MVPITFLWEDGDPRPALAERFGFADGDAAARWVEATVRDHWDITVTACTRIVISGRKALAWVDTAVGPLIMKWSAAPEQFPRLAESARLIGWLGARGLPVSAPISAGDGRLQVEVDGRSVGLQRLIAGELLDVGELPEVRSAGAVLARLHEALATHPETERFATSPLPSVPAAIAGWLDTDRQHLPARALDVLRRLHAEAPPDRLPRQLLHGDVRSANLLCADHRVVAVLDFEESRVDPCVDELARSAVLLGTRFRAWGPVPTDVHAALLAGYASVRRLTPVEAHWWDLLRLRYALGFVPVGPDPTGWGPAAAQLADSLLPRP